MPELTYLLTNAKIHTLDGSQPHADSVMVRGGRIVSLDGALGAGDALVEDLNGAAVLPGFVDAHIHWQKSAEAMKQIDLFDLGSKAESLARVQEAAKAAPPGKWLLGFGWAQGMWEDTGGAFPTAADLDAVAPNNPVYLSSRSYHAAWVNSAALKAAGIDDSTPNPPGSEIQRGAGGKATGVLFEDAMGLVKRVIPGLSREEIAAQMKEAQELAWKCGLTGLHDFDPPSAFEAMQLMHERGELGLRIVKNINDPYIDHAHTLRLRSGFGDDWLRLGALKMFSDGAIGSLTARMLEPYNEQPENRGITIMEPEEMYRFARHATMMGFHSAIHAIGDEAMRQVLDVLERVRKDEEKAGIPREARRHRIEHVQVVHPDDVRRLAELDIIASMQPIHATADYLVADRYWGDRCKLAYNPRVQIDAGARVAFGSDSPVEPFDPIKGIHAAVTRQRPDGSPGPDGWYPEARVTIEEAIHGYTTGPAWAAGMEGELGKLMPGYLADLVVLDRDPFTTPPEELLEIKVLATMAGGKWRHRGEDFASHISDF